MASAQITDAAVQFVACHWIGVLVNVMLFLGTYLWIKREIRAPYTPSALLVPSTSTYPSMVYTTRHKIPAQQFIDDLLQGRIELRDAQSGHGMARIADVVSFRLDLFLVWRVLRTFILTAHSEHSDRHSIERYVLASDSLLEEILGPDRLPLVGYIREGVPDQLESCLRIQMQRVASEYLDLNADDRLLDINAQWGDLAVYLAHDFQVPTCAIVATSSQLAHATNLTGESQVQRFLRFVMGDYRAIKECLPPGVPLFTKVIALDALDMVGSRNIPVLLRLLNAAMDVNGRLLLQVTSTPSSLGSRSTVAPTQRPLECDDPDDDGSMSVRGEGEWAEHWWYHWFRQHYIQPGADTSMLVTVEQVMAELQKAGFEVLQVESLTADAALTTAIWCNRLCASKRQIEVELGEDVYRAWELYLNWTQSMYARARLHKHFILAVKRF
ncbi:hypothetical protein H4S04_006366 [Coemansia sp. S16]|nr:hypothetical protein LPJ71_003766 [Coemansia sp. S17]KAJ2016616.1 hypothetical protein GGI14_003518 [Coemansia sp. S680]KAJ2044161.1 hypothetical protein H4S04_006366 [Coemansia sp. S16]KAJ2061448.1 hypothetical protein GGI08_002856 [Coemansia sp. S2]